MEVTIPYWQAQQHKQQARLAVCLSQKVCVGECVFREVFIYYTTLISSERYRAVIRSIR